jgi:hypothetical protein
MLPAVQDAAHETVVGQAESLGLDRIRLVGNLRHLAAPVFEFPMQLGELLRNACGKVLFFG